MLSRCRPARRSVGGLLGQQDAVGRQGQVVDAAASRGQLCDEPRQVGPHERLAAGEPQPPHAHLRDDAHEPRDLLERQNLVPRLEADVLVRHAVEAADVAAIGDADPQAAVHAAEAVDERALCSVIGHGA